MMFYGLMSKVDIKSRFDMFLMAMLMCDIGKSNAIK